MAKEGCCKGRSEKARSSIWNNELWVRVLLKVVNEQKLPSFACEYDWPISGNPSRSIVPLSFYVLYPLMGAHDSFLRVSELSEFTGSFSPWTEIE